MKMTTEIPIAIIHEGESRRETLTLQALPAVKIIPGDNRTEVEVILVLQRATKGVVRQGAMGCPLGPTGDLPAMATVAQLMVDHMAVAVVHQGAKHHHRAREETLEVKGVKEATFAATEANVGISEGKEVNEVTAEDLPQCVSAPQKRVPNIKLYNM